MNFRIFTYKNSISESTLFLIVNVGEIARRIDHVVVVDEIDRAS